MATRRRVVYRSGRRFGCLGPLLLVLVVFGVIMAVRATRRPRAPARPPTLPMWEETEPGVPSKAPAEPTGAPAEPTGAPVEPAGASAQPDGGQAAASGGETRGSDEALAAARACLRQRDHECCIRELRDAPRTDVVTGLLLMCYQTAGHTDEACALARQHPDTPGTQQFIARQCEQQDQAP